MLNVIVIGNVFEWVGSLFVAIAIACAGFTLATPLCLLQVALPSAAHHDSHNTLAHKENSLNEEATKKSKCHDVSWERNFAAVSSASFHRFLVYVDTRCSSCIGG